jgi:hypothetical protein
MYPIDPSFISVFGSHFIPNPVHPHHLTLMQTSRQAVCQELQKAEDLVLAAARRHLQSFLFAFVPYKQY